MVTAMQANFVDAARVQRYVEQGPPAFVPGHSGLLQMIAVLFAERMPKKGTILVVGAGGGLETRYLAGVEPNWRFVGVDPAPAMLDLARRTAGSVAGDRLTLIEGEVGSAPAGPFDAATCILVLGLVPDDGGKLDLLQEARRRMKPGAPFVLVDHCLDRERPGVAQRIDRYAAYARRSGVDCEIVAEASANLAAATTLVPATRDEQLLREAGFTGTDLFYLGMEWRGWVAYA